jgi:hypothetical protein
MTRYVISLPKRIPDNFFRHLDGNVYDGIKTRINKAYSQITKTGVTDAKDAHEAIRHIIFRELGTGRASTSLAKMFGNEVTQGYVFEVPPKSYIGEDGKRLSEESADTFQKMELATMMDDARSTLTCRYGPEQFFGDAVDMINAFNRRN